MIINLSRIDFGGITGGKSKPEEVFDVQPTTSDQTITPTEGSVFSGGTVRAVTSAIDNNIVAGNIKEGVSILGVAGTLKEGEPNYRYMNGTVDRAGLKAIGWTEDDILRYEQNTPHYPWQNDRYIVSDENKALYSLDDPNPSSYKDNPNIEFVPNKNMESYFAKIRGFQNMKYIKGIPYFDTSNMTNMSYMFGFCTSLTTIPLLDTSSVTNMNNIFNHCTSLTTIPQLNISNVNSMLNMFSYCSSLATIPLLDTSKAVSMNGIFSHCTSLTTIPRLDTSNVTSMTNMFNQCTSLTTIPQLDTAKVTSMGYMFSYCSSLTTIPRLDTSKVTSMYSMFDNCTNLTTVEGIDFSGLTSELTNLFGTASDMSITRFIVNGKINVSISDNYSIKALTAIDYDSVKSILAAADRTDNTNAKELAFNRTMTDQNGELAALVASCSTKGWTITGLTLN